MSGKNIVEKILGDHIIGGALPPAGEEIAIRIDQCLTQDATGTMAWLQFESLGLDRVKAEVAVSYVDHNTIQVGFENADDHAFLKSAAAKYGAVFSPAGNGICHQLQLEQFGAPGKTLLGSDSHTPTGGGLGMFAMGAGGIDVAVAMGGGAFYITRPKVRLIKLLAKNSATLPPGVSAKDIILKVLEKFGTKGNVGWVMEYGGDGVKILDVPSRATITNMGAELGVTTSVFPSDETTKEFLIEQGRGEVWREIAADPDAEYDDVFEIDLTALEPLAACPHSPGNIATVASLAGMKVNQVLIGSCTNASYRDLKTVAEMFRGKKVHPSVSVGIAPGSRQVVSRLAREGLLEILIAAGCRLLENACGFCIGNSMSPGTNGVSLRTSNRNFEGRSGTKSGQVYLVSPETAAASALSGVFTAAKVDAIKLEKAENLTNAYSFIMPPPTCEGAEIRIERGPNIAALPMHDGFGKSFTGEVAIKVGDKITTDHIMPAGARLKYRSNVPEYSKYVFEGVDPEFHDRALRLKSAGIAGVIVAGESYGQGSSREHAAMCPMYLGVRMVIAKSIERIHQANLVNFGIIPCIFEDPADYDDIAQGAEIFLDDLSNPALLAGEPFDLRRGNGRALRVRVPLSPRQMRILFSGGLLRSTQN